MTCRHDWTSPLGTACPLCQQDSSVGWDVITLVTLILLCDLAAIVCAAIIISGNYAT